eukprot:gene11820-8130_t
MKRRTARHIHIYIYIYIRDATQLSFSKPHNIVEKRQFSRSVAIPDITCCFFFFIIIMIFPLSMFPRVIVIDTHTHRHLYCRTERLLYEHQPLDKLSKRRKNREAGGGLESIKSSCTLLQWQPREKEELELDSHSVDLMPSHPMTIRQQPISSSTSRKQKHKRIVAPPSPRFHPPLAAAPECVRRQWATPSHSYCP